jgi:hypothetical protein
MTAGVDCKFTVHFSTSFCTTSFRDAIPNARPPQTAVDQDRWRYVESSDLADRATLVGD